MALRRRIFWILPDLQAGLLKQWCLLVLLTTLLTQGIALGLVWLQDWRLEGEYLFVSHQDAAQPVIMAPTNVGVMEIVLPALVIALALNLAISLFAGLYYSHRLAGPIYRIRRALQEAQEGKPVPPIVLRKNDQFKDLAEDINRLLAGR
ncbi:MAG: hypothetical protein HY549_01970 [Elusimicrobia bacterium]|nr:hypothetical protein [Elusimicrobiota bacterium]